MRVLESILSRIREHGPITVAEYMELALYDPSHGYYSRVAQRSGRDGDFFTSVDVGSLFGELLAVQFEEMWRVHLGRTPHFDIVEAGAGNGRLSCDVLDAARREHPEFYGAIRLWIVERSTPARRTALRETLIDHRDRVAGAGPDLPSSVSGVIFANELLDAMPAHAVRMTSGGLREIYVSEHEGRLVEAEGPLSDATIARQIAESGAILAEGARADVSVAASRWVESAARALTSGFLLLVDYGHPAAQLYSATHASGTLMTYRAHTAGSRTWLESPGQQDLTTHVDLTATTRAAEAAGLRTMGIVDQTYFLTSLGLADRLQTGDDRPALARRLAAKTLVMPGGLGSTMKVMVFARNTVTPGLSGLVSGRLT
jgi:SAM-dependent MidA family methyltransferase